MARKLITLIDPPIGKIRSADTVAASQAFTCITEYLSPDELKKKIIQLFCKKFGKNLGARAENFADKIVERCFCTYNNFNAIVTPATIPLIERAIEMSQNSQEIRGNFEQLLSVPPVPEDEIWDDARVSKSAGSSVKICVLR